MDIFKPGRTQFHTFEVWNYDLVTVSNPPRATQFPRWFRPSYNKVEGVIKMAERGKHGQIAKQ